MAPRSLAVAPAMRTDIITTLAAILESRKLASPEDSYTASLFAQGVDGILQKVGEEATEVILAAKDAQAAADAEGGQPPARLVHEVADLWFHCLVLLVHLNQEPQQVLDELSRRLGTSGHAEKAQRGGK